MASNPNAGIMKKGDLFSTMRFVLVFKAKEANVIQLLNALAANSMVISIRKLTWQAPRDQVAVRKQVVSGEEAVKETTPETKETRIVSGREANLSIRLDLDVYRFEREAE